MCIHSLISIFIVQPQSPYSFCTMNSRDINSSSCPVIVRMMFSSWVCSHTEWVAMPAYFLHSWALHTNKYTLAEIRLPCTTISCFTSRSAMNKRVFVPEFLLRVHVLNHQQISLFQTEKLVSRARHFFPCWWAWPEVQQASGHAHQRGKKHLARQTTEKHVNREQG